MVVKVNFIISVALLSLVLVLGFILHKTGKPYNFAIFNAHKLISLGLVVLLSFIIYSFAKHNELAFIQYLFISWAILSVIALFASGALLSLDRMHFLMLNIHRIGTGILIISLIIILYRVFLAKN